MTVQEQFAANPQQAERVWFHRWLMERVEGYDCREMLRRVYDRYGREVAREAARDVIRRQAARA